MSRFLKNETPTPGRLLPNSDSESGPCNSDSGNRLTSNWQRLDDRLIHSVVEEVLFVLPKLPKVRPAVAGVERGAVAALDDAVALAVELLLEPDHVVLLVLFAQLVPDILQLLFSEVVRF